MAVWPFTSSRKSGPVPLSVQKHPSRFSRTFAKWSDFNVLTLFEPKRPPPAPRTILVNTPVPTEAWKPTKKGQKQLDHGAAPDTVERHINKQPAPQWHFPSNQVLTSKYNLVTYLPKNLTEQFRRVANVFFLVLVILQFFPRFSNVSPALAALPLIVVLAITAIKDGYEDIKRHQSDRRINNIKVHVLAGGNYRNVNMTAHKSESVTLRAIHRLFNMFRSQSTGVLSDDVEMENVNDQSEHDEHRFTGDMRNRRKWWGTRVRKVKKSPSENPRAAPGGGTVQGARTSSQQTGMPSILDDEPEQPKQHQTEDAQSPPDIQVHEPASKDDVEVHDIKRRPAWTKTVWEDLKVGDFVRLSCDDSIPADILVCATSEEESVCYVETKNLDGETNLKTRSSVPELAHLTAAAKCSQSSFIVHSEAPDTSMASYSASVELCDGTLGKDGKPLRVPITLNTMLLRGCVLRNTEWVIGLVVFTGRDTKIVLNSGLTPSKRSKVERQMNPQVFVNLALLGIMCSICAIADHYAEVYYYARAAPWQFGATLSDDNPNINGIITFANGMIAFQNIVPISLYISIEFIRLIQAFFIWADDEIKYRPAGGAGKRAFARSWNLSDDLGQIEYVFSDKTGTLTQNSMQFRQCTIAGKVYKGEGEPPNASEEAPAEQTNTESSDATRTGDDTEEKFAQSNMNVDMDDTGTPDSSSNDNIEEEKDGHKRKNRPVDTLEPFHDQELTEDLARESDDAQRERLYSFFINLGLCHTVLTGESEEGITYKAQSPDEAALVQAAADVGFVFCGREKNILRLQVPNQDKVDEYELLNVLEFTSARKRMSVIVRKIVPEGEKSKLLLLCKGADNVIFERLGAGNDELKHTTDRHLEYFATEGLRTLTLAHKYLDDAEFAQWEIDYNHAETLIDNREAEVEKICDRLEQGLTLLGATAIEDKLQDGVPKAIGDLKRAGIKVWVATGDKLETAIAIGMSSNLLSKDMNLIVIRGGKYGDKSSVYEQMRKAIIQFFDDGAAIVPLLENQPPDAQPTPRRPSATFRRSSSYGRSSRHLHRTQTSLSGVSDLVDADNGQKPGGYGLVIEGSSLSHAFEEPWSKDLLLELATRCNAVVCCRTSPLQKALIVRLVRSGLGTMCLAIGDGANDVSMIQAADVGVGVSGEEGMQAVNASDYAIAQFRFLSRLLLLHGHWDYVRNSNLIMNFWEKEIIGIGILFWFQFYCLYSTTTVYEYTYLLFWNIFWTIAPVLAIGLFERHLPERTLMSYPELYSYGRRGTYFGLWRFSWYMMDGVYQSIVCYFFVLYYYDITSARSDGYGTYIYEMSTLMAISAVWVSSAYIALNSYSLTWWIFGACIFGPITVVLFTVIYSAIKPGWIWTPIFGNNHFLFRAAAFWFGWILTFLVALFPRYIVKYYKASYAPSDIEIMRYVSKFRPFHDVDAEKISTSTAPGQTATGTTFSEAGEPLDPSGPMTSPSEPYGRSSMHQRRLQMHSPGMASMTDMSTGLTQTPSRGYGFDQADGMGEVAVGRPLRRYTSSLRDPNDERAANRPRSRSIRFGNFELGIPSLRRSTLSKRPSLLGSGKRSRAGSEATESTQRPNTGGSGGNLAPSSRPTTADNENPFHSAQQSPSRSFAERDGQPSPTREELEPPSETETDHQS